LQIQIPEPCTVDIAADGQRHEASVEAGTYDPGAEDLDPSVRAALLHLVANGLATVAEDEPGEVAELERTEGTPVPAGAVEEVSQVGDSQ
jgi:hypothetical protein